MTDHIDNALLRHGNPDNSEDWTMSDIYQCHCCDIWFRRTDNAPVPHNLCDRCYKELSGMAEDKHDPRDKPIEYEPGRKKGGVEGKQFRYQDRTGDDWIDEFARTATPEEFRGAMRFTIGKYNRRMGKKDDMVSEIRKMRDYCDRWLAYEEDAQ